MLDVLWHSTSEIVVVAPTRKGAYISCKENCSIEVRLLGCMDFAIAHGVFMTQGEAVTNCPG